MARWNRYNEYPEYISVGDRKKKNEALAKKLSDKNKNLHPVILKDRAIAKTFWGKAWCENVESYQDYENRLPRGRSYVRNKAVLDLQITKGKITALVAASHGNPYNVTIKIAPLEEAHWNSIKEKCTGKIQSLLDLIRGKLSSEILKLFCDKEQGLFPKPSEIKMNCSCPDWAALCKHLAAVLYGVGARLDEDPKLFFTLRGVDEHELIGEGVVESVTEETSSEIASDELKDIFGIDLDSADQANNALPQPPEKKTTAKKGEKKTSSQKTKLASKTYIPKAKKISKSTQKSKTNAWKFAATPEGIQKLRKLLKVDQKQLAELCGISTPSIKNWETGKFKPTAISRKKLEKIANRFGY